MRVKKKPINVYRVVSCVIFYVIENYVCIDYLCCQYKTLNRISSDKVLEQASYIILLDIGIPEVLMILVSWHGLIKKQNSTVILNCRSSLANH